MGCLVQVGFVFAAFGWGYASTQVIGSIASQYYGAKRTWLVCLCAAGFCSALVPVGAAYGGLTGAALARFAFGMCQGPLFPIQVGIIAGWLHVCTSGSGRQSTPSMVRLASFLRDQLALSIRPSCPRRPLYSVADSRGRAVPGGRLPLCVGGIWSLAQALQSACTPYLMSAFGWESPFYIYPLLVALWARLWMRFGVEMNIST